MRTKLRPNRSSVEISAPARWRTTWGVDERLGVGCPEINGATRMTQRE